MYRTHAYDKKNISGTKVRKRTQPHKLFLTFLLKILYFVCQQQTYVCKKSLSRPLGRQINKSSEFRRFYLQIAFPQPHDEARILALPCRRRGSGEAQLPDGGIVIIPRKHCDRHAKAMRSSRNRIASAKRSRKHRLKAAEQISARRNVISPHAAHADRQSSRKTGAEATEQFYQNDTIQPVSVTF